MEELSADDLDSLEPLWLSLLEHHGRVSPPALRMVGPADSWPRRRRLYRAYDSWWTVDSGVGTQLLDAVEGRLRESGTRDLLIGVVAGNADALRFYERRGATPFYTQMYRRL